MANTYLGAYDTSRHSFVFQGFTITGFANDTYIDVERKSDGWSYHAGANGDFTRAKNLDKGGTFTLSLEAGHPDNAVLQSIADEDEAFSTGFGTCQVIDHTGDPSNPPEAHSPVAWIRKQPKLARAKEPGKVQWVIDCGLLEVRETGNLIPAVT